jgi:hypothetical protein
VVAGELLGAMRDRGLAIELKEIQPTEALPLIVVPAA